VAQAELLEVMEVMLLIMGAVVVAQDLSFLILLKPVVLDIKV
jgi:hypothetical protein